MTYGSDVIGRLIEPIVRQGSGSQKVMRFCRSRSARSSSTPRARPPPAKAPCGRCRKSSPGTSACAGLTFALISPDIWRKQLLDYGSLGAAYKYAGAFTSEELQIVDQKLDRYMALKHERGGMVHLLIDRFRFDSFAPDSDEAGQQSADPLRRLCVLVLCDHSARATRRASLDARPGVRSLQGCR